MICMLGSCSCAPLIDGDPADTTAEPADTTASGNGQNVTTVAPDENLKDDVATEPDWGGPSASVTTGPSNVTTASDTGAETGGDTPTPDTGSAGGNSDTTADETNSGNSGIVIDPDDTDWSKNY